MPKTITAEEATKHMLDRYTKKGGNREQGAALLANEIATLSADSLAHSLIYWDFATPARAEKLAAAVAN